LINVGNISSNSQEKRWIFPSNKGNISNKYQILHWLLERETLGIGLECRILSTSQDLVARKNYTSKISREREKKE